MLYSAISTINPPLTMYFWDQAFRKGCCVAFTVPDSLPKTTTVSRIFALGNELVRVEGGDLEPIEDPLKELPYLRVPRELRLAEPRVSTVVRPSGIRMNGGEQSLEVTSAERLEHALDDGCRIDVRTRIARRCRA